MLPTINIMPKFVDKAYFTELANANPTNLCRNNRCSYFTEKQHYSLKIWGDQYLISPGNSTIEHSSGDTTPPHDYFYLFVIYYLLRVKDIPLHGEWISEKDVPGGPTFFRGPHLIPTDLISQKFGNDIGAFKARCEKLGGTPVEMADAAFRFEITPDIPVTVLLWSKDDDFPAEAKLLYDRSIIELLSLDILFALGVGVCSRIGMTNSTA